MRYKKHFRNVVLFLMAIANFTLSPEVFKIAIGSGYQLKLTITDGDAPDEYEFQKQSAPGQYVPADPDEIAAVLQSRTKEENKLLLVKIIHQFIFYKIWKYKGSLNEALCKEYLSKEYERAESTAFLKILINAFGLNAHDKMFQLLTNPLNQTRADEIIDLYGQQQVGIQLGQEVVIFTVNAKEVKQEAIDIVENIPRVPLKADEIIGQLDCLLKDMAIYWILKRDIAEGQRIIGKFLKELYSKRLPDQQMPQTEIDAYVQKVLPNSLLKTSLQSRRTAL